MKQFTLSNGLNTLVNGCDYDLLSQWNWYYKDGFVASNQIIRGKHKIIRLHRVIAKRMGLNISGRPIDHIDGNRLNNCRNNLRVVTPQQNAANQRCHRDNQSGYKGVSRHKQTGKWHARIHARGRCYHLGLFAKLHDAALAYNQAAQKHFGTFARLNVL